MGRTHPQLPRSLDSHRILEGKARQRWLVPMDHTLFGPSCRELGQWCKDPPISTIRQILLPLGSSNWDSVYTMQDAFPKLVINLINLTLCGRKITCSCLICQAQCRLPIKDSLIETLIMHSYERTKMHIISSVQSLSHV